MFSPYNIIYAYCRYFFFRRSVSIDVVNFWLVCTLLSAFFPLLEREREYFDCKWNGLVYEKFNRTNSLFFRSWLSNSKSMYTLIMRRRYMHKQTKRRNVDICKWFGNQTKPNWAEKRTNTTKKTNSRNHEPKSQKNHRRVYWRQEYFI